MISAAQHSTGTSAAARPATNTRFIHFFVTLQIHFIILANIADRKGIEAEARRVEVQAVLWCVPCYRVPLCHAAHNYHM